MEIGTMQRALSLLRPLLQIGQGSSWPPEPPWPPPPRTPDLYELEPNPGQYRYFADWSDSALPKPTVIWQIGESSGRYVRPSGDLYRLWRWDLDEKLCNEFDEEQGRWVESINYEALFYYGQGYIMEPISSLTAQKVVVDLGWPKALTDRRYLSYDDIAALADETCEEPEPTESNAVDLLIAESMPTLRPDVVRRLLGWPDPPDH